MNYKITPDPKPSVDPNDPNLARTLAFALDALGLVGLAGRVDSCVDSGGQNGGDGGGNLVLVTTELPHGLNPGDHVVLAGTGPYDGGREVEPTDLPLNQFLILNVAFSVATTGGTWRPA